MNANKQSRVYAGWIVRVALRNGGVDYYGPFATNVRAQEYARQFTFDPPNINEKVSVEELVIPHACHVYIETQ